MTMIDRDLPVAAMNVVLRRRSSTQHAHLRALTGLYRGLQNSRSRCATFLHGEDDARHDTSMRLGSLHLAKSILADLSSDSNS